MGEKNFSEQRNSFWRKMNTAEGMVMKKPPQRLRCSSDRGGEPCVKKPEAALEDSSHVRDEGLSYNNAGDNINIDSPLSDVVWGEKGYPNCPHLKRELIRAMKMTVRGYLVLLQPLKSMFFILQSRNTFSFRLYQNTFSFRLLLNTFSFRL